MPLIDITSCVFKGDDAAFPGIFNPPVDGREGFCVLLSRKFRNRMIKLCFGHILSLVESSAECKPSEPVVWDVATSE